MTLSAFKNILIVGLLFLPTAFIHALDIPAPTQNYVNDWAEMITPQTEQMLEQQLREVKRTSSQQILVITLPSLEGDSLEDFSIRLVQKWKPGQAGLDNGVLLLVFKEDRAIRIEVGYGLEGVLTDAVTSQIIREEISPRFREGKYDEGFTAALQQIVKLANTEQPKNIPRPALEKQWGLLILWALVLGLVLFIIDCVRFFSYSKNRRTYSTFEWWFRFSLLLLALQLLFRILMTIATQSGGGRSGGGFSGGGGRFGGGGASGRW